MSDDDKPSNSSDHTASNRAASDRTERTLSDSLDDTPPPPEEATLIIESVADPEATFIEPSMSEPTAEAPSPSETSQTMIIEPSLDDTPHKDTGASPSADSSIDDATSATMIEPSVDEPAQDAVDATLAMPPETSEIDATVVGYSAEHDADATGFDDGAVSSDPFDQTIVQQSGADGQAGTASGTAADYIPPMKADDPGGRLIGRFQIEKMLGQGAFGAVYLAHDPHLDRKVAIKVAKTGVLVGKQDVDRFMREARSAAQLRHPNIVPVYEVGHLPNTNFIAYDYVEGCTLGDVLKDKKKLTHDEAATYMRKIASGLHYAHEKGIVHRDMKPDNVLVDKKNEPHIADFGLARRDEGDTQRTREGMFMGTPSYMSPEQAGGKAHLADARSDVWALGVMLQEMLTGVRPFRGNVTEVLVAVQNYEPPSVRSIDHNIPKDLETIVEKCLTKTIEERYQSAQELADELERWQRGEPILARPISVFGRTWRWMQRNPAIASLLGTVFAVLLVGFTVSSLFYFQASRSERRAVAAAETRASSQLNSLRTADAASLPVLIEAIEPFRDELKPQILAALDSGEMSDQEQSRMRFAATTLYPDDPRHPALVTQAADDLLTVSPDDLVARTQLLQPFREQIEVPLWNLAQDETQPRRTRFQALAGLASLKSPLPNWSAMTEEMVAEMLTMNPLELSGWLPAVRPIRQELEEPLTESFLSSESENDQYRAAMVMADLYADTPETLVSLIPNANPKQLAPLLEALRPRANVFSERLAQRLEALLATDERPNEETLRRAANVSLALLGLGETDPIWPLLGSAPDKSLRTTLIHEIPAAGIDWHLLATQLEWRDDPLVLAALLLSLGEYGDTELIPADRESLSPKLIELISTHPNVAVHSAAEWVLRRWGRDAEVDAVIAQQQSKERSPTNQWHIDGQGRTFVVLPPAEFLMGSPENESGRSAYEQQHRRLIPRTFGLSTHEVTIAEYREFDQDYNLKIARKYAPQDDCPVIRVKWYDAIAFCRWLSEKEGFEERDMCYPPLDELAQLRKAGGRKSLVLPDDLLDRPGYRLPTAAEYEYAARAGAVTARPFGNTDASLDRYAWNREIAKDHTWPTGLLKPNDNGLFDIQGNALEWCQNFYFDDPPDAGPDGVVVDGVDPRNKNGSSRECRGGSILYPLKEMRVAAREYIRPSDIYTELGFRLARTYVTAE